MYATTPQFPADLKSILPGQHYVEQDNVELAFPAAPNGGVAVAGHLHSVSLQCQVLLQPERNAGLIFHYQNPDHVSAMGSSTVNTLPSPGRLSSEMSPPCAVTI